MAADTEPRIARSAEHAGARVDVFESGTHVVVTDALYVTASPSRRGLRAQLHLTRWEARDLRAALEEVLG